jgi:hypothetical protein
MCGSPDPTPTTDARLMLYLTRRGGNLVPQGWLAITAPIDRRRVKQVNDDARRRS